MAHKKFTHHTSTNGNKYLYIELFNSNYKRADFIDSNNNRRPAYSCYVNGVLSTEQYFDNGYFYDNYDTVNNINYFSNGDIKDISKYSSSSSHNGGDGGGISYCNKMAIRTIIYILFDINGNITCQQYYNNVEEEIFETD